MIKNVKCRPNKNESEREERYIIRVLSHHGGKKPNLSSYVNGPNDYDHLIPVIIKLLPDTKDEDNREFLVRAITAPNAREIAQMPLLDEFQRSPIKPSLLKWTVGNAIYSIGDYRIYDKVLRLVCNTDYGDSRQMLASYLGKMKDPSAVPTLLKVLHDEGMSGHVINALGHIRDKRARKAIVPFLKHPNAWYRQQAAKAIERIDEGPKAQAGAKSKGATTGEVAPKPASRRVRREK